MQQRHHLLDSLRSASVVGLSLVSLAALTACGGGGGDSSPATVSSASNSVTKYGVPAVFTYTGTHLNNLNVTMTGCRNVARLTTAPTASSDTTAYFSCTPSGTYSGTVTATSNGSTLNTQSFTVKPPIVSMAVSGNGVAGNIVFNLKGNIAPITVDNFLDYVNAHFYDGTVFHRVAHFNNPLLGPEYFVVQGGSYTSVTSGTLPATSKTPLYNPIKLETTGGTNVQWTAAMARTSVADSATSGFFFNVINDSAAFDPNGTPGYAVFADVSGSASVITAITQATCTSLAPTGFTDGSCVPIPNVVVTSATQTQ